MKFTILENEINPFRYLLEAILGGLPTASSSRSSSPPGLGPEFRAFSGAPGVAAAAATSPN